MKFRSLMAGAAILLVLVVLIWAVSEKPVSEAPPIRADPVEATAVATVAPAAPSAAAWPQIAAIQPTVKTDPPARPLALQVPVVREATVLGRLLVPVSGVRPSDLADTYEQARGQGRRHDAIDIPAKRGTPVLAVADGTVLKLFLSVPGGIVLYQLAADEHTIYYYAHLERYADGITDKKSLRQGDLIGYVGDTGNAGAGNYHLHFAVSTTVDGKRYWGGTPQNPYPLLRQAIAQP